MSLKENQIEELYKFTRQHFVEYYDVQTELVDHLANDIEAIWIEKPALSFEQARDMSFQKFGVFGFMEVIEEKQKALNKKYFNILWGFAKEWFTVPKILITGTIFMFFFLLLQYEEANYILVIGIIVAIFFEIMNQIRARNQRNLKKKNKERIFLLEEMIYRTKGSLILYFGLNLFHFASVSEINFKTTATYWLVLAAFLLTSLAIVYYITEFVIPKKADELLESHYSEYKIS